MRRLNDRPLVAGQQLAHHLELLVPRRRAHLRLLGVARGLALIRDRALVLLLILAMSCLDRSDGFRVVIVGASRVGGDEGVVAERVIARWFSSIARRARLLAELVDDELPAICRLVTAREHLPLQLLEEAQCFTLLVPSCSRRLRGSCLRRRAATTLAITR